MAVWTSRSSSARARPMRNRTPARSGARTSTTVVDPESSKMTCGGPGVAHCFRLA
jgi:hypothetical protein